LRVPLGDEGWRKRIARLIKDCCRTSPMPKSVGILAGLAKGKTRNAIGGQANAAADWNVDIPHADLVVLDASIHTVIQREKLGLAKRKTRNAGGTDAAAD